MNTPRLLSIAVVTLALAMTASGQPQGTGSGTALEDKVQWIAVLYAVIALLGIAVVAFKNAKRTHLD